DVVCYYYARGSLRQAGRMFYQYGAFKPLVARKVGRIMTVRQLVPAGFVATLLGTALGTLLWPPFAVGGVAIAAAYAFAAIGCAVPVARSHGIRCALALVMTLPVVHVSYGSGFLLGLGAGLRGRSRGGHVVGTHSHTHPDIFRRLPRELMTTEWRVSRAILEALLGEPCIAASVPGGDISHVVLESAGDAGIRYLFTSEPLLRPERI